MSSYGHEERRLDEMLLGNGQRVRLAHFSDRLEAKILDPIVVGLFAVAGLVIVVAVSVMSALNDLPWRGSGGKDDSFCLGGGSHSLDRAVWGVVGL